MLDNQEPLLSGEVRVTWDHAVRLIDLFPGPRDGMMAAWLIRVRGSPLPPVIW